MLPRGQHKCGKYHHLFKPPQSAAQDAEHIRLADQFVEVPGGANANNYANVRLIVQVAQRAGVDAVWPGW